MRVRPRFPLEFAQERERHLSCNNYLLQGDFPNLFQPCINMTQVIVISEGQAKEHVRSRVRLSGASAREVLRFSRAAHTVRTPCRFTSRESSRPSGSSEPCFCVSGRHERHRVPRRSRLSRSRCNAHLGPRSGLYRTIVRPRIVCFRWLGSGKARPRWLHRQHSDAAWKLL